MERIGKLPKRWNRHHLCYNRADWNERRITRELRDKLIIPLPIGLHDDLHDQLPTTPLPPNNLGRLLLLAMPEDEGIVRLDATIHTLKTLHEVDSRFTWIAMNIGSHLMAQRRIISPVYPLGET